MRVVKGREDGISNREGEIVLVQLSESCREVVLVAKALGKAVSLVLKPPNELNHQE